MISFIRVSIFSLLIGVLSYCVITFLHIVLANILSPEDYGDYALAISLAVYWASVAELGGSNAADAVLPQYIADKNYAAEHGFIRFFVISAVVVGFLVAIIGTLLAWHDFAALGKRMRTDHFHPLVYALWLLPAIGVVHLLKSIMLSYRRFIWSRATYDVLLPGLALLFIWYWASTHDKTADWHAVYLMGGAYVATLFFNYAVVKFFIYSRIPKPERLQYEITKWLKLSIPFLLIFLLKTALWQIGLILIEILSQNENDVGYFAAISRINDLSLMVNIGVSIIIVPLITVTLAQDKQTTQRLYSIAFHLILWPNIAILVFLILSGHWLLSLFGPQYVEYYASMLILAIGNGFTASFIYCFIFLQFAKYQRTVIVGFCAAILLNVMLNMLLIPKFSVIGAAVAMTISTVLMMLWFIVQSIKKLDIVPWKLKLHNDPK